MAQAKTRSKSSAKPVPVLVTYRPKPGQEKALLALVKKHWGVLDGVGLVTGKPAQVWQASDKKGGTPYFVELFEWKDEKAPDTAHTTREVMAVWGAMGQVLDRLEIAHLEPVAAPARRR